MKLLRKMADFFAYRIQMKEPNGAGPLSAIGDAGERVDQNTALSLSAVWACVNLLSGTISSLPLMVYRLNRDGERQVYRDHPLYRMLHDSPNFDQTSVDFWDFLCSSIELSGNGYARKLRSGTRIAGLEPINPFNVVVRRLTSGVLEYSWTQEGRSFRETDESILHIRGFGGSPLGGLSTLSFARNSLSLARAVERSAGSTFRHGLRPSGVLTFKDWLSPDNRKIAEEKLEQKFMGAMNSGRPLILEGGTTWQQLMISPEDAQMLETRGFTVEEICRFFGVPPFMIGHTEKTTSWGTGLEQQILAFQKFTLRRRLKRIEQALEKQLLTPAEKAAGVSIEFNLEGLLRGDSNGRANFYRTMTQIGAMTINEVRALENMPRVDGGDTPRVQMQNVPITEADQEAIQRLIAQQNGATP
ncbi:phage portal protein [Rhizobium sp. G21]|uniref:phage portal protein n=1 Tax=Rhizobium sp. G21 TaxID=2758439 RepID=UPI0015FF7199|nr:phage portal protein [Rhizobium sp. G21]MBB1247448.1 phage portal protein [Rhizobium sp. G21]